MTSRSMAALRHDRVTWLRVSVSLFLLCFVLGCDGSSKKSESTGRKKDVRDYNDADMARLLEQWEKDDDIEEGDLPEHLRPSPQIDLSKLAEKDPKDILRASKKGRTLMIFASVSGTPTEKETEEITSLWQTSLFNANYDIQRFIVGENRAIFMLKDGSLAWEVKDFLIGQDRCADVTVEGQVFPGKGKEHGVGKNKEKQHKEKSSNEDVSVEHDANESEALGDSAKVEL
uniref:LRP chaperone MESD n=1 Tax=Myxine glutinosa TaxID=7769 RepID=UPI00358EADCA